MQNASISSFRLLNVVFKFVKGLNCFRFPISHLIPRCANMLCCTREFNVPCFGSARKLRFCPYLNSYGSCDAVHGFVLPLDEVSRCASVRVLYTQLASNWPTRVHVAVHTAARLAVVERRQVHPVFDRLPWWSMATTQPPTQPQCDGAWHGLSADLCDTGGGRMRTHCLHRWGSTRIGRWTPWQVAVMCTSLRYQSMHLGLE